MEIRERRTPPPELGGMLNAARMRAGLRLREAARVGGVSHAHLINLEMGRRVPSRAMAMVLIDLYRLDDAEREQLLAASVDDAGRGYWRGVRAQRRKSDGAA